MNEFDHSDDENSSRSSTNGSNYESNDSDNQELTDKHDINSIKSLPLHERIALLEKANQSEALTHRNTKHTSKKRKLMNATSKPSPIVDGQESDSKAKKSKHAPAVMKSNRPVSRLRLSSEGISSHKFRDPRFSDVSGKLNYDKFRQSFNFLEENQQNEVEQLQKSMKKIKNPEMKESMKQQLTIMKQEMLERHRNDKLKTQLSTIRKEDQQKSQSFGKKPFYLKKSAIKEIELEQRFDELKKGGKLKKFLEKKRKKNISKDRKSIPYTHNT